ncbi:MAG: sulfite exporter TauE/SafE family protein [Alphaproteobacteria bacterium]
MNLDVLIIQVLPHDIPLGIALFLIVLSFFTSALTAAVGIGGGLLMLAAMASVLPTPLVIPTHGAIQFGSNIGRATLMRRHVIWIYLWPFLIGSIIGAYAGARLFISLPVTLLQVILGLFILIIVWAPKLTPHKINRVGFFFVGVGASFSTMFIGATGPLVAVFLPPERFGKHGTVATHATFTAIQHLTKVIAFSTLGFAYWDWLPLLAVMIFMGFLGTNLGNHILNRLPQRAFAYSFKVILTLLAMNLLWEAARNLI